VKPKSWLFLTFSLWILFSFMVVGLNCAIDHYGILYSLFSKKEKGMPLYLPAGLNQHIFNPEYVFRHHNRFDGYLFGSSRTAVIDTSRIPGFSVFNMSYPQGLPQEHLDVLQAFLRKGIKLRLVMIGLDDFCFSLPHSEHERYLMFVPHPEVSGQSRFIIFMKFFYRLPTWKELDEWWKRIKTKGKKGTLVLNADGQNLSFMGKEEIIKRVGKPIFAYERTRGSQKTQAFNEAAQERAFSALGEIIRLSKQYGFDLIFFINPHYAEAYEDEVEAMMRVKERLAGMTGFYDFSGFNAVTVNPLNYYEESHYRYGVGDLIIGRIFPSGRLPVPPDFGRWVTAANVRAHLARERKAFETYLKGKGKR